MMRAVLCKAYGPVDGLVVEDVPTTCPGPRQILIDVKSAGLNFPDALMVQGLYPAKPPLPFTPGMEMAGVVIDVGAEVVDFKSGDRVIASGLGAFAEECVVDAANALFLPDGMDYETGATFMGAYTPSLHGLGDCGRLQPGETLLVLGAAGGVGLAAVEIGKAMGARVVAAASSAEELELCGQCGADATISYTTENLRDRVNELTDRRGVDVVFDPVGGVYTEPAVRSLAWGGRLLVVGFAAGSIPRIALNLFLLKERSLIGAYLGDSIKHDPKQHRDNIAQLLKWFALGKLRPVIRERVPLAQTAAAMGQLIERKVMGRVVILTEA